MNSFSSKDIDKLDYLYRINLINSCSGFKSANLIGTQSKSGISNVAIFSSLTHIGSSPPLLGFFCRPTVVTRDTYDNIKETGIFTCNHVCEDIIEEAHHTSAKYDKSISEFDVTQLKSEYKSNCKAPFVKGAPVQMEMEFVEEYFIKANDTILVVGALKNLYIQEGILKNDGFINLSEGHVVAINGLDGYAIPKLKTRLDYQRPKIKI